MKSVKVYQYDAFGKEPNKGNPAGIVFNADHLTEEEMQTIAQKVGFSEVAFPIQSAISDVRIRYFKPGHEMSLCGHATIAAVYALKRQGFLGDRTNMTIETKAGVLPIQIVEAPDGEVYIVMKQAAPQFEAFNGSLEHLAQSIGIAKEDIDTQLPTVYGSTGTWTLLVPIKTLEAFKRMQPHHQLFPAILKEMPTASVHPFCLETYHADADMHARHFPSPISGSIEDPVTGTASGVMGAYFAKYIKGHTDQPLQLVVEQGQEMDKDGRVIVNVARNGQHDEITITGNAVYVKTFEVVVEAK